MNVILPRIVLAGTLKEFDRWCDRRTEVGPFAPLVNGNQDDPSGYLLKRCTRGMWWIVRLDRWQYDERVISALHTLAARPGVELVDPTGLLGGSRYGLDGDRPASPSVVATAEARGRVARKRRTGDPNSRTWQ